MLKDLLKYGYFPMFFDQDGGTGDAGAAGGDAGAGGAGGQKQDDGGDTGADGGDSGNTDDAGGGAPAGDAGGQKPAGGGDTGGGWSEKWREEYSGDDEKKLQFLNRFTTPNALIDKIMEQDKLIRSGGHKTSKLPEDASDEQKSAYRKEQGIPEKPDGYYDAMPEGFVLGEDLKEGTQDYVQAMHDMNAPPEFVAKSLEMLQAHEEAIQQNVEKLDAEKAEASKALLKEEWRSDYEGNMNALRNFLDMNFDSETRELFESARLGDDEGTPLLAHAGAVKALVKMQRELNPHATRASGQTAGDLSSIEAEIDRFNKEEVGKGDWYKNEKKQAEYRSLLEAKERYKSR